MWKPKIPPHQKLLEPRQLKTGDVLLFDSGKSPLPKSSRAKLDWLKFWYILRLIKKQTESNYTHAAICYDNSVIVEATGPDDPVTMTNIEDAISSCRHVAVLRNPYAFQGGQVERFQRFADRVVDERRHYNTQGVLNFAEHKEQHLDSIRAKLDSYFAGDHEVESFDKASYFCSELVVACFRASGFIDEAAAVYYDQNVISPADLGRDVTFGSFLGFLSSKKKLRISKKDQFFNVPSLGRENGGV